MKKLIVILITIALVAGFVSAILVTTQNNQTTSSPQYASNYKSHGSEGAGSVNQKFDTNPHWYNGCEPWNCPPGLVP